MEQLNTCRRAYVDMVMIESAQDLLETKAEEITSKCKILGLLSNEVRLKIMLLLQNIECICVCDLSDILQMNQSPISQHLRKLKDGGLLQNRREGMTIYYFIPDEKKKMIEVLLGDQ